MKCKDIPDQALLDAVDETDPMHGDPDDPSAWRNTSAVISTLSRKMGVEVPERLFLAKARKLIDRKVLFGCACGCRGDFHTSEG